MLRGMTTLGSLSEFQLLGSKPRIAAIRGPRWVLSAADPDPVIGDSRHERPLLTEAANQMRRCGRSEKRPDCRRSRAPGAFFWAEVRPRLDEWLFPTLESTHSSVFVLLARIFQIRHTKGLDDRDAITR